MMVGVRLLAFILILIFIVACEPLPSLERSFPGDIKHIANISSPFVVDKHISFPRERGAVLTGAIWTNTTRNQVFLTGQDGSQTVSCYDTQGTVETFVVTSLSFHSKKNESVEFSGNIKDPVGVKIGNYSCQVAARSNQQLLHTTTFNITITN